MEIDPLIPDPLIPEEDTSLSDDLADFQAGSIAMWRAKVGVIVEHALLSAVS